MTAHRDADDAEERLRARCASVGFDLDKASRALIDRMLLLAEHSETLDDALRMSTYAERIFRHYDVANPNEAFTAIERQTILLACLFADVGKTGPVGADADARRVIAEVFGVDNVGDDSQPLASFLRSYFPADAEQRIARLAALDIDPMMPIRQFWNLHTSWTLAIAEAGGLPLEVVAAAASHHLLDDINPLAIVGDDDQFTCPCGDNPTFDRAEKLVIILDKYDAVRRRGGRAHDEAIAWIRARIARSDRFRHDEEFSALVADVDIVNGAGER